MLRKKFSYFYYNNNSNPKIGHKIVCDHGFRFFVKVRNKASTVGDDTI